MSIDRNRTPFIVSYALGASLIIGGLLASITPKTGCDKTDAYHVHQYTTSSNTYTINKYSTNESRMGFVKTDNLVPVTSYDVNVYEEINDMFDARENIDYVESQIRQNRDYIKYYYEYEEYYTTEDDEGNLQTHSRKVDGWTTNPNNSHITGRIRIYHTRYFGYKIQMIDNQPCLVRSEYVDDPRDIIDEYPYINYHTQTEVYEKMRLSKREARNVDVEDITPFYTPNLDDEYQKTK